MCAARKPFADNGLAGELDTRCPVRTRTCWTLNVDPGPKTGDIKTSQTGPMPHLPCSSDNASHIDHCIELSIPNGAGNMPAIRVSLQRWGIAAAALRAMVATLNATEQRIVWSDHQEGAPADMIVHVVDAEGLAGPSLQAPWNLMGPVDALRAALEQGVPAIALATGEARHLPMIRTGHWITSGSRNLVTAARILAGAAILDASETDANAISKRLSALASQNALARLHRVVAASPEILASSVRMMVDDARRAYAAPSILSIGIAPGVELALSPGSTRTRILRSQPTATEADVLLAYPWPNLSNWLGPDVPASS